MKRRYILIIAGVLVLGFLFLKAIPPASDQPPPNLAPDGKEYERGGPASLVVNNTGKLNALLVPEQFFAVKESLTDYVFDEVDPAAKEVSLQKVWLNPDGNIDLIVNGENISFEAKIIRHKDSIAFRVPSSGYEVVTPVSPKIESGL